MDISVKVLLISAIWMVFWWLISFSMREADPVKWKFTDYGVFPASMLVSGIVAVFGSAIWLVVRL